MGGDTTATLRPNRVGGFVVSVGWTGLASVAVLLGSSIRGAAQEPGTAQGPGVAREDVTFSAADGAAVFGSWFRTAQGRSAIIVAFHQGGASGVAEYAPIVPRLTAEGYDVLVVDLRAGGDRFGGRNRTVEARGGESGYCEAAPDLAGALRLATADADDLPIILWGSSFSGALVLRLAAEQPRSVAAVLAFSPASGGPMVECRGEDVSGSIRAPVLALRPSSEMKMESSRHQFEVIRAQGHRTFIAEPGTHGSSMLVEERVDGSTAATWDEVLGFLRSAAHKQ